MEYGGFPRYHFGGLHNTDSSIWLTKFHGLGLAFLTTLSICLGVGVQLPRGPKYWGGGGGVTSWVEAIGVVQMPVYCVVPKPLLPYHHPEAV